MADANEEEARVVAADIGTPLEDAVKVVLVDSEGMGGVVLVEEETEVEEVDVAGLTRVVLVVFVLRPSDMTETVLEPEFGTYTMLVEGLTATP